MNIQGTNTGRITSNQPAMGNTQKAAFQEVDKQFDSGNFAALEDRAMARFISEGTDIEANTMTSRRGKATKLRVFTLHERYADTYQLADALKPTDLVLHLNAIGMHYTAPLLCTYQGKQTGALVRHAIYP